jgi:phage/plasmid-associated DNA primase
MDFYRINTKVKGGAGGIEVSPEFLAVKSTDLMIRGGKFYAVWNEEAGLWSLDEYDLYSIIDKDVRSVVEEQKSKLEHADVYGSYISNFNSTVMGKWKSYISSLPDNYKQLDSQITFANTRVSKVDYVSKRLPYALEPGDHSAWDELVGTLYDPEEKAKIEWAIGSIVSGDSTSIQKFLVLYGSAGTGKSTVLQIIELLFTGYVQPFEGKALTSNNSQFGTEAFRDNPLVVLQHDGDLSRIEDNSKLNSIVSHETMVINEKYKSSYSMRPQAFIFMGTNSPVKISDSRSGILRRLIDVQPTGKLINFDRYQVLMGRIEFELGALAHQCLRTYKNLGRAHFDKYRPLGMMYSTNVFFNFIEAYYNEVSDPDGIPLKRAYSLYKEFCVESENKPMQMQAFREEMLDYFETYHRERVKYKDGMTTGVFAGFKPDRLKRVVFDNLEYRIDLTHEVSLLDSMLADRPAQYATEAGTPKTKWSNVSTTLSDIDTRKLHFVTLPEEHIVIDFDIKDADGKKSIDLNLEAASSWPPTYTEYSQSGLGVHLHYIYGGDVFELSNTYSEGIEVKTLLGSSSLRRKLTKCNNAPVATLTSGLPIKEKKVVYVLDQKELASEKGLRALIGRNLRKEIHPGTKPSIDFIKKILDDAYSSDFGYDVTDLRPKVVAFANNSSNRPLDCLKIVQQMKFKSETSMASIKKEEGDAIVFFDVEVYPNLFVVCWKIAGHEQVVRMINPSPTDVEQLFRMQLVGFNNRRYDNHILYARFLGYDNEELYYLSQKIINGDGGASKGHFGEAYGLSYTDVYDFSSKKQGLKKFQIELGLNHSELDLPWDQPVPNERWDEVVEYCVNDVETTEKVFEDRRQDFIARQILADISGLTVNDTTQRHTAKIVFGDERNPQSAFIYPDLSEEFPGYVFEGGKSTYKGLNPSEGGYVWAKPGIHANVGVLDIASMHPTSIEVMNIFGPYTKNYTALKEARLAIKHGDYEKARELLNGKLKPYLNDPKDSEALSYALKIVINIVYGLTSAKFDNPFRDIRNVDNVVAKRGALFMIDLHEYLDSQGIEVVHIKTDSIKIVDPEPWKIEQATMFAKKYGYDFEYEKTYAKFCLVNDAVYIAQSDDGKWDAVGAQFQHPFVYKTVFSGQDISFADLCETKSVQKGAIYIDFERDGPAESIDEMHFIGRTGSFVPVAREAGGGKLYRVYEGKKYAVAGTKDHYWMESAIAQELGLSPNNGLAMGYFYNLSDSALDTIEKFGPIKSLITDWE